jgi:hypothetical protein
MARETSTDGRIMRTCIGLPTAAAVVAAILMGLGARDARSEPIDALPKTVIADVKWLEQRCRDVGGTPTWTADELIKQIDLSPDGVPDYVIEAGSMDCDGRQSGRTPWTSSGGAQLIVWISVGRDKWARAFDADVFIWNVSKLKSQPVFYVLQNIGYCGKRVSRTEYRRCAHEYVVLNGRLRQISEAGSAD